MIDGIIKKKQQEKDHLEEQLSIIKNNAERAPEIQQRIEQLGLEIKALKNRPEQADELLWDGVKDITDREFDFTMGVVPPQPRYDGWQFASWIALTTSGSSAIFDNISRLEAFDEPKAQKFSKYYTDSYRKLQQARGRIDQVRQLLVRMDHGSTIDEFELAVQSVDKYKSAVLVDRQSAANHIRNFLDSFKGALWARACSRSSAPKNGWLPKVAPVLSINPGGPEEDTLIGQEQIFEQLRKQVNEILHNRDPKHASNLDNIWTQVLDLAYVVLGLIKL